MEYKEKIERQKTIFLSFKPWPPSAPCWLGIFKYALLMRNLLKRGKFLHFVEC
jgi:hypothetical protein